MSRSLPEKLYRYPEAAERLGIAAVTLRKWVMSGAIGYIRLGSRAVRFRESDLAAVLTEVPAARGRR